MVESSFKNKYMTLFLFLVLLSLARTSNTMIKDESGKSGHPCLVPEFRDEAFNFLLLSMMLASGFS